MPGWQSLIVCGSPGAPNPNECGFLDLIALVRALITDFTILATLLVVVAAVIIGFTLLTSQGNPGALGKVKHIAWNVFWGYVWIIIAWVVVYTVSGALLAPGYSLITGIK